MNIRTSRSESRHSLKSLNPPLECCTQTLDSRSILAGRTPWVLASSMSTLLTALGLRTASTTSLVPPLAPYYLLFNIFVTYIALPSCLWKNLYGIDNNVSPRDDLAEFGEVAVREGKLTQAQLNKIVRIESAHANAVENLPVLIGALLFAGYEGMPKESINRVVLIYSLARVAYAIAYHTIEQFALSFLRTAMGRVGTASGMSLLWQAAQTMNAKS